jgi:hypothetical protein
MASSEGLARQVSATEPELPLGMSSLPDATIGACVPGGDGVRNGDRWNLMDLRDHGSIARQRAGAKWGGTVIVPADYVAEHVELG